ncbi:Hydroxyneurosporene dehydrogenase [Minicystis rosea]|nr:Hydroxyneurosporene dehydrogenase [Minicystis rosea]
MSDDGRSALSLIAMLGSVFSPFYFAARAQNGGRADPLAFPALNVALYTPRGDHWVLTERTPRTLSRSASELSMGPSVARWEGGALVIDLDERTAPIPRRLAGTIRLHPETSGGESITLDAHGRHRWCPIAPSARAEVELRHPSLRFRGHAYLDANGGDEPLENGFRSWTWARVSSARGAVITYDVVRRDESRRTITRAFDASSRYRSAFPFATIAAPPTLWRMKRDLHADHGAAPRIVRTLEDTPFYARSLVHTRFFGEPAVGTHETLSLDRFRTRWVQFMLPYRMRRETQ